MCQESSYGFGGYHADCGCGYPSHRGMREHWQHQYGCCCGIGYAPRRFPTREEIIEEMEEYLEQLRAEAKGVEEQEG